MEALILTSLPKKKDNISVKFKAKCKKITALTIFSFKAYFRTWHRILLALLDSSPNCMGIKKSYFFFFLSLEFD
jgi:hypothetical protein